MDVSNFGETTRSMLLNATLQAVFLALIVATICRLAGRRLTPRWQFALWGLVFVRLACPVLPPSQFSALNLLPVRNASAVSVCDANPAAVVPPSNEIVVQSRAAPSHPETSTPRLSTERPEDSSTLTPVRRETAAWDNETTKQGSSRIEMIDLAWSAAFLIWAIVVGILLVRHFLQRRRLRAMAAAWQDVTDGRALQVLEECRRQIGVRRSVRLLQTDRPVGPALLGLLRPRIVLPRTLVSLAGADELRMLFLHELAHVRRADVLWERLAGGLVAVHWFNPAAWWALARLRDAREKACDAAVLSCLGREQAGTYGRLLIALALRQGAGRRQSVLVGAMGQSRYLQRRIEMIVAYRKSTWKHTLFGASVLAALVACGLTSAQSSGPARSGIRKNSATDRQVANKPAEPHTLDRQREYVISGRCTDENKRPLSQVRVRLFRIDPNRGTRESVREVKTDDAGTFRFADVAAPTPRKSGESPAGEVVRDRTYYAIAATKRGRASWLREFPASGESTRKLTLKMPPAGTLSGRVTDKDGRPIRGAKVFIYGYPVGTPVDDVFSAVTDADGKYAITDLRIWDADKVKPRKVGNGVFEKVSKCFFTVLHPDYGMARPAYHKVPSVVGVTLQPAAKIEGTIVDRVTGKPAANATVSMQGIHPTNGFQQTRTNDNGQYRLSSVATGRYNIWADAPGRTCVAIDSLKVVAGKTYSNKNISLIEGAWLEGRVIDADTGKPLSHAEGRQLAVAIYGPSRPRSGAAVTSSPVDKNGRFGLRVAPGRNFPYIMTSSVWQRTEDREKFRKGIVMKAGELVSLDFRVLAKPPRKKPEFSPVRLAIPVPEERAAAAAVRRLGGWYQLDGDRHVVEVNMVYHYTREKVRHDNGRADTDEILQWVPKFPRLKRLFLKENQASDKSMRFVAKLTELEVFFVWDAHKLSDAGVRHLRTLKKLKNIHIGNSQIGDGALQVFGRLPNLERLSLQGNQFTDAGVPHLAGLKSLKSLWIGSTKSRLSDRVIRHLVKHKNLEQLDLQGVPVTDAGVKQLQALTRLRTLDLGGAPADGGQAISDAAADVLARLGRLESLFIQKCVITDRGARKLAALPHLKQLSLEGSSVTPQTKSDLKKRYPGVWINIPLRGK
jgi:beta-lactamase regulating signal transducer with metallopeptidase domain/5-hydroxyisourate hydrolase-like protein (transthyretin family)